MRINPEHSLPVLNTGRDNFMKIYLDDERSCPDGYILVKTAEETIEKLKEGNVTHLSLDHDLGTVLTGYDVLLWLEEQVSLGLVTKIPHIFLHTQNPVGKEKMRAARYAIGQILLKKGENDIFTR